MIEVIISVCIHMTFPTSPRQAKQRLLLTRGMVEKHGVGFVSPEGWAGAVGKLGKKQSNAVGRYTLKFEGSGPQGFWPPRVLAPKDSGPQDNTQFLRAAIAELWLPLVHT